MDRFYWKHFLLSLIGFLAVMGTTLRSEAINTSVAEYYISSIFNKLDVDSPHVESLGFYLDKKNYPGVRKLITLQCQTYRSFGKIIYYQNVNFEDSLINHDPDILKIKSIVTDMKRPFRGDPKSLGSEKSFSRRSQCEEDLALLYRRLLTRTSIFSFDENNIFSISETDAPAFKDQIDLNFQLDKYSLNPRFSAAHSEAPELDVTNFAYYHGHKTPYVFVFLHGLFNDSLDDNAKRVFSLGNNTFSISYLVGHADENRGSLLHLWESQTENLLKLASKYGEKVIVVGHSLGGNFAIQMAQKGLAHGLILLEPAIKVNNFAPTFLSLARVYVTLKDNRFTKNSIKVAQYVTEYVNTNKDISHQKIKIPTLIYANFFDPVVSFSAQKKFAERNSKFVTLIRKNFIDVEKLHMYDPFQDEIELNNILSFLNKNVK